MAVTTPAATLATTLATTRRAAWRSLLWQADAHQPPTRAIAGKNPTRWITDGLAGGVTPPIARTRARTRTRR